jgi:alpha-tubulin suppressor-like RCC1 family protein
LKGAIGFDIVSTIESGIGHVVVLNSAGSVFAWGRNGYGSVGDSTTTGSYTFIFYLNHIDKLVPVAIGGALIGKTVTKISASGLLTICLTSNQLIYAWGILMYMSGVNIATLWTGDGTAGQKTTPTALSMTIFASKTIVKAGISTVLALTADGYVYGYGQNYYYTVCQTVLLTLFRLVMNLFPKQIVQHLY